MKAARFCAWLATAALCALPVNAQKLVPRTLTIQGVLRDGAGALQTRATNVTVRLFAQEMGGDQVGETSGPIDVQVVDGLFSLQVPVEPAQWAELAEAPWLELTVGDDKYTRQRLTSVPYALASASAEQLSAACSGCVKDPMIAQLSATKITDVLPIEHGGTGVNAVEDWRPATFNAQWENYTGAGGYAPMSYFKDPFGVVHLRGFAQRSSMTALTSFDVFTLPEGYRPERREIFIGFVRLGSAQVACRIDVAHDSGQVTLHDPCKDGTWISVSGISFRAR